MGVKQGDGIDARLADGRQYRDINVSSFERRAEENGEMIVEGYATTFNQPYELWREAGFVVMEQVSERAFDNCDMTDVIMQYNHEGRVFARTGNGTLSVVPDTVGLRTRARLDGTELGRQVWNEIDGGYTTKMSFGFRVRERERNERTNAETGETEILITITDIEKLFDVSAVSIPANDGTSISSRSFAEGVIGELKQEMLARQEREKKKQRIKILTEVNK